MDLNMNFYLRDTNADKETPIFLIFRYGGKEFKLGTGRSIHPKNWNFNTQSARVTKNFMKGEDINDYLKGTIIKNVEDSYNLLVKKDNVKYPDVKRLRDEVNNILNPPEVEEKKSTTFYGWVKEFIEHSPKRINRRTKKTISQRSIQKYKTTLKRIRDFEIDKKFKVEFDTMDSKFYESFVSYSRDNLNLAENTIGKDITTIKTFLNAASKQGLYKLRASEIFFDIDEKAFSIYLNKDELKSIINLDLSKSKRLDVVRDYFIIGCYTGLRYSDLAMLSSKKITGDLFTIKTKKTDNEVTIPILPPVENILKKYNYKLPRLISNAKFNLYIKEVCELCNPLKEEVEYRLTKGGNTICTYKRKCDLVSVHTGRRSFASNMYKLGIPTINIMRITGHNKESTFLKYIKMTPEETARDMLLRYSKT